MNDYTLPADLKGVRDRYAAQGFDSDTVALFQKMIYRHYQKHGRDFPWRNTGNPYHVLVSEIMLQQTQVKRVITKFGEFIGTFPDFSSLSRSSLEQVLAVWQGLGYNRRAKALKDIAVIVVNDYGGELPASVDELISFPGIGRATASSIAAFAFNKPVIFLETNIRSVFIYLCFPHDGPVRDEKLIPLVATTLDRKHPGNWYNALMDFGTVLKSAVRNPSRRSAHYTRQGPFEGSNRQVRGMILKTLLTHPGLTERKLVSHLEKDRDVVRGNLEALCNEGLITKRGTRYAIS